MCSVCTGGQSQFLFVQTCQKEIIHPSQTTYVLNGSAGMWQDYDTEQIVSGGGVCTSEKWHMSVCVCVWAFAWGMGETGVFVTGWDGFG